ncbi:hypothetical protein OCU04_007878 [Sclerotinia nivalis]|uniref:Uncharacterized protein n=1 Tax=Sclerotinia nivalis TaxID=352851 RepID=A0A9X0DJK9_9HELO|nr:hypothetical protein OCU04_007878 [Sclerotinia nivalis]
MNLNNIAVLADFLMVPAKRREFMRKRLASHIEQRKAFYAAKREETSGPSQKSTATKRAAPREAVKSNKKTKAKPVDLTKDDDGETQTWAKGHTYPRDIILSNRRDTDVAAGSTTIHDPDRVEPSNWRNTAISRKSTTRKVLIQSLSAKENCQYYLPNISWVAWESKLFSILVKDSSPPSKDAPPGYGLAKMLVLEDWHEGENCISLQWDEIVRYYATVGNPEAVIIQGWGPEMAFKALEPWLERINRNYKDWVKWKPEVLEKAKVVETFIGSMDQQRAV